MPVKPSVIAIDGTFASGKGTLARALGVHYNLPYLDTGKLYRLVAYNLLAAGMDLQDGAVCADMARRLNLQATDVALQSAELNTSDVAQAAAEIAVHPPLREALLTVQRQFAKVGGVLDGRDIGTVICPQADIKFYVDAAPEIRARRRHEELKRYGEAVSYETVLAQLCERDRLDKTRGTAPLCAAENAHLLDTTNLSIERAFDLAVQIIEAHLLASQKVKH